MHKVFLSLASGFLLCGSISLASAKTMPPKKCVNNLMCVKGKKFVCNNGKPTCVKDTAKKSSSSSSSVTAPVKTSASVDISGFSFSPAALTVKKGTTVTWKNADSAPHTVTGDSGGPKSGNLTNGQSYSFTFDQAGSFPYHCNVHPGMKASVTVTQ